jgi:hypothetical protein
MKDIVQIAKTCHAVHLTYCESICAETQPNWDLLSLEHRNTIIDSVYKILDGIIEYAEQSHDNFVSFKKSNGWVFDNIYSLEKKKNPRLVDFKYLSKEDQTKEYLFFNCVKSFL